MPRSKLNLKTSLADLWNKENIIIANIPALGQLELVKNLTFNVTRVTVSGYTQQYLHGGAEAAIIFFCWTGRRPHAHGTHA